MASPRIQVIIDATADGLRKGVAQARGALDGLDDKLAGIGKSKPFGKLDDAARDLAEGGLGPLGEAAGLVGVDLGKMSTASIAGGAAVAGLGAAIASGLKSLSTMTEEVRKFNTVSGAGWDASSRFVAVMDDLGISADTGSSAVGRLAKNVAEGKLEEFGLSAVKAKDGTVDLAATLGVVADAMNSTADPTKRAEMGTKLLGKSWADLAPLLQLGSKGIADATKGVKDYQIISAQTAKEQRDLSMAVDDLQDSWKGLTTDLANETVPTLTSVSKGLSGLMDGVKNLSGEKGILEGLFSLVGADYGFKRQRELREEQAKLTEELDKAAAAGKGQSGIMSTLRDRLKAVGNAALGASESTLALRRADAELAKAAKDAADAVKDKKSALDAANGVVQTVASATLAYQDAVASTTEADQGLAEKAQAAAEAVQTHGENSAEAVKAKQDYAASVRDAEQAALGEANAAVEQARQLAIASGQTFTAEQANNLFKDALGKVRERVTDPALQAGIDQLAALTQAAADNAANAARWYYEAEAAASRFAAVKAGANVTPDMGVVGAADRLERAVGGNVTAGTPYTVGEAGPEMFVPQSNGRILTADDLARVGPGGGGGVVINVNTPIGRPDDVVRWLREELRRADRGMR